MNAETILGGLVANAGGEGTEREPAGAPLARGLQAAGR